MPDLACAAAAARTTPLAPIRPAISISTRVIRLLTTPILGGEVPGDFSRVNSRRFTANYLPCSGQRIAHLGTADCCVHPPGRNEMIAITPPIISSKEVAQKQATPFPRQDLLTALDEFSIFARPPPRGLSLTPGREAFHPMDAAGRDHLICPGRNRPTIEK